MYVAELSQLAIKRPGVARGKSARKAQNSSAQEIKPGSKDAVKSAPRTPGTGKVVDQSA